ncbi:MAG: hypothetical protein GY739_14340, partial [Mesoflavibacter sp.]|nr:hypothetical protein [Mesoflavibacter sp.]
QPHCEACSGVCRQKGPSNCTRVV